MYSRQIFSFQGLYLHELYTIQIAFFSHCYARASKGSHDVTTSIHIFIYTYTVPRIHKYYPERIKSPAENTCDPAES